MLWAGILACLLSFSNAYAQKPAISNEVISDMMNSIPSPLEISFLIKDLEIKYNRSLLMPIRTAANLKTDIQKPLYMGIYSTNLGYTNIYQQKEDALAYTQASYNMAEALQVGKFFDKQGIEKLVSNNSNGLDDLLTLTSRSLNNINTHLTEKDRPDLTVLILVGGWVESLYLTCAITKQYPNELLKNRIGEQKIILEQLLLLLSFYEDGNKEIKALIEQLNKLNKAYETVKITYTNNGMQQSPTSEIMISEADLKVILAEVNVLRQFIINQ